MKRNNKTMGHRDTPLRELKKVQTSGTIDVNTLFVCRGEQCSPVDLTLLQQTEGNIEIRPSERRFSR